MLGSLVFLPRTEVARDYNDVMYSRCRLEIVVGVFMTGPVGASHRDLAKPRGSHSRWPMVDHAVHVLAGAALLGRMAVTLIAVLSGWCCGTHLIGDLLEHVWGRLC